MRTFVATHLRMTLQPFLLLARSLALPVGLLPTQVLGTAFPQLMIGLFPPVHASMEVLRPPASTLAEEVATVLPLSTMSLLLELRGMAPPFGESGLRFLAAPLQVFMNEITQTLVAGTEPITLFRTKRTDGATAGDGDPSPDPVISITPPAQFFVRVGPQPGPSCLLTAVEAQFTLIPEARRDGPSRLFF